MSSESFKRFSIIGAGNVGCHLLHALRRNGYILSYIYKKSKCSVFNDFVEHDIARIVRESDSIFICTQESRIAEVATLIATSAEPAEKCFFHTSNSLHSGELDILKEKGGLVASFSPLQTFPAFEADCTIDPFQGIYFLAEGDETAMTVARQISKKLGAHLLHVNKEDKIYFHIAAVCASNFLISILKLSEKQLAKISDDTNHHEPIDIKVLMPLIKQTLKNVENRGVDGSLTGPFKRKEMGIVDKHLEYLQGDEADLYKALTAFLMNVV